MAVTAVGTPDPEPSKADLLRALQEFESQVMAGFAEIHRRLDAMTDAPSPARAAEPLPPGLDEQHPMRGFLMEDPE